MTSGGRFAAKVATARQNHLESDQDQDRQIVGQERDQNKLAKPSASMSTCCCPCWGHEAETIDSEDTIQVLPHITVKPLNRM